MAVLMLGASFPPQTMLIVQYQLERRYIDTWQALMTLDLAKEDRIILT